MSVPFLSLVMLFSPLIGSFLAATVCLRRQAYWAQIVTILGMTLSTFSALQLFAYSFFHDELVRVALYTALDSKPMLVKIGLYLDRLTLTMAMMVTIVSLLVHIFAIEYMKDDRSQPRFFAYISLFTFMMLLLVLADNLIMLFAGWEGVGLVSYLLIGFWMTKPSAVFANLKAFLVNRVGDLGLLMGIAAIFYLTQTFDYSEIMRKFAQPSMADAQLSLGSYQVSALEFICCTLFIGAMGKSAQIPLHLWLPDSMEGPTPISALIHAATMVTAGIFMVARFDDLFILAPHASSIILVIGSTTALLMGFVALVQRDIKKIVAYSTLSQLGYMVTALGLQAYNVALFHLLTHAFFKALLFLTAGAVILVMDHKQDIFAMGGLWRSHKSLFILMMIGSLSLMGVPPFSGFYSKDLIIIAAKHSELPWSEYAYYCTLFGVLLTSIYSLRLVYYVFLKEPTQEHPTYKKLGFSALAPLWALAFFSLIAGLVGYEMLFIQGFFSSVALGVSAANLDTWLKHHFTLADFTLHGFGGAPLFLIILSFVILYVLSGPAAAQWQRVKKSFLKPVIFLLEHKFGFDHLLQFAILPLSRSISQFFSCWVDGWMIDKVCVDSQALVTQKIGKFFCQFHTGVVQHSLLAMSLALASLWLLLY